jgi:hypothetical protein
MQKRSTDHHSSVQRLRPLFESVQPARPVLLLGAGASFRAGIPLAEDATKRIVREACAQKLFGTNNVAKVKLGDIMRFLSEQSWFIPGQDRLAENFPLAVEHLLVPREYRKNFFSRELRPVNGLSDGYRALARLAQRGLWRTALTTNFDACLVDAIGELTPHIHRPIEINKTVADSLSFTMFGRNPQVVYLHGAVESYTDKNTHDEIANLPKILVDDVIKPLLASSPLVVVGYRGAEPSVMQGIFNALLHDTGRFRCGVYWCDLTGRAPHEAVQALQQALGTNFVPLTIDGFDELFVDLDLALKSNDIYAQLSRESQISASQDAPEDECPLLDTSIDELDHDLILATLVTYCEKVGRPAVDRQSMFGLLREQGLATIVNEILIPTLGGFLLFGIDVQNKFPQCCVELTFSGKKRQIIKGNLIHQFHSLIRILGDTEVNQPLRIKTNASSQTKRAYHERSITEMVVNLLVHRDYKNGEHSKINVQEGRLIRFENPGGLPEQLVQELGPDENGQFQPIRSKTHLRNGALADIFYGLGPMDKRGSGLCDAVQLMKEQGGNARYAIYDSNSHFVAELLQARQDAPNVSETAVALNPYGTYITNHLRFKVLPPSISTIELSPGVRPKFQTGEDLLGAPAIDTPIFIIQKERIASFSSAAKILGPTFSGKVSDFGYFSSQPGGHSTLAYLLRVHFVRYLARFSNQGLFVEAGGHRAFFIKVGDETPKIRYNTAKRKGIEREMVKRREVRTDIYHENEGIAFDVVRFDGGWALEIKPFYMFTESDGRTPLPGWRRGRLSTSRMRFDRNQAVRSDLGFWARYLSVESSVVQLCPTQDYDLLLEGAFHEVDVLDITGNEIS